MTKTSFILKPVLVPAPMGFLAKRLADNQLLLASDYMQDWFDGDKNHVTYHLHLCIDKTIHIGEWGINEVNNPSMSNKPFQYLGPNENGIDLIDVKIGGREIMTTIHFLTGTLRIVGSTDNKTFLPEPTKEFLKTFADGYNAGLPAPLITDEVLKYAI